MTILERINKNTTDFRKDVLEIDSFQTGTLVAYNFFKDHYSMILDEFESKERDDEEKEGMGIFKNLNENISNYESDIYSISFINLIARTEAFLNDILETLFLWKKQSLISDKLFSYKEILESQNIDELVNKIRENSILEFSHMGFRDKLKFLKKKFKLTFPSIEENIIEITELFTTRNIILHNNGKVNKTYLNVNKTSKFKLGEKRKIDRKYLELTLILLVIIGKSIDEQIIGKLTKDR